jgi:nucleoside-diphosphate kinase
MPFFSFSTLCWNPPVIWNAHFPFCFLTSASMCFFPLFCNCTAKSHSQRAQIKPDGIQRGIVGNIVSRFETKGYKLVAMKTKQADKELLEKHYKDLVQKPFFPKLRDYMLSGPVVCMVWEGKEAVSTGRKMLGATNPLESAPGTIRGDFCIEVGRNICRTCDCRLTVNAHCLAYSSHAL